MRLIPSWCCLKDDTIDCTDISQKRTDPSSYPITRILVSRGWKATQLARVELGTMWTRTLSVESRCNPSFEVVIAMKCCDDAHFQGRLMHISFCSPVSRSRITTRFSWYKHATSLCPLRCTFNCTPWPCDFILPHDTRHAYPQVHHAPWQERSNE